MLPDGEAEGKRARTERAALPARGRRVPAATLPNRPPDAIMKVQTCAGEKPGRLCGFERGVAVEQILYLNACVRPESRTLRLADRLIARLEGDVTRLDLDREELLPLNYERLLMRDRLVREQRLDHPMLRYARQFARADTIVLAAPYWDLSFPALVKLYCEAVTVTGVTFRYREDGRPEGLCRAKRLYYVTTAGGPFVPDFGFAYVRALAGSFFGIPEVRCFCAEQLDIVGNDAEAILAAAMRQIDRE